MIAAELLAEARAAGVELTLGIRLQGVCSPGLRDRLKAHEPALLVCLLAEAASRGSAEARAGLFPGEACKGSSGTSGSSEGTQERPSGPLERRIRPDEGPMGTSGGSSVGGSPALVLPDDADPARPPGGWTYVGSGPLAGCWVGPNGELAPAPRGGGREESR